MMPSAIKNVITMSCAADLRACPGCFAPKNCDTITVPPVAIAVKMQMIRLLIISTSDTPETCASPTPEIITVSIMPTEMSSICSMIIGTISFLSSWFVKSGRSPGYFMCFCPVSLELKNILYIIAHLKE